MHLALRAAIKASPERAFLVAEIALPDSASVFNRFASRVPEAGAYRALVLKDGWGRLGAGISERANSLAVRETSIEVDDSAGGWRALVASYNNRLRRCPALVLLGHADAARADWMPCFTGVLDSWPTTGPGKRRLNLRVDDRPLSGEIPKHAFLLSDWPKAKPEILGKFAPIVLGVHNSTGVQTASGTGMVPTYHVDTILYRHAISLGKLKAVVPVFGDGVTISASNYSIVYVTTASGRIWTCVQFNVATHETKTIRVDCEGLTDQGDGSGVVVTSPVAQLDLILTNFAYGDWKSGAWLDPGTSPLDQPLWSVISAYGARKGWEGSYYLGGDQVTGESIIEAFAKSWGVKPYWTGSGKLGACVLDHGIEEYLGDAVPWLRGRGDIGAFKITPQTRQILSRMTTQYLPSAADGRTFATVAQEDLDVSENVSESTVQDWSAARRG